MPVVAGLARLVEGQQEARQLGQHCHTAFSTETTFIGSGGVESVSVVLHSALQRDVGHQYRLEPRPGLQTSGANLARLGSAREIMFRVRNTRNTVLRLQAGEPLGLAWRETRHGPGEESRPGPGGEIRPGPGQEARPGPGEQARPRRETRPGSKENRSETGNSGVTEVISEICAVKTVDPAFAGVVMAGREAGGPGPGGQVTENNRQAGEYRISPRMPNQHLKKPQHSREIKSNSLRSARERGEEKSKVKLSYSEWKARENERKYGSSNNSHSAGPAEPTPIPHHTSTDPRQVPDASNSSTLSSDASTKSHTKTQTPSLPKTKIDASQTLNEPVSVPVVIKTKIYAPTPVSESMVPSSNKDVGDKIDGGSCHAASSLDDRSRDESYSVDPAVSPTVEAERENSVEALSDPPTVEYHMGTILLEPVEPFEHCHGETGPEDKEDRDNQLEKNNADSTNYFGTIGLEPVSSAEEFDSDDEGSERVDEVGIAVQAGREANATEPTAVEEVLENESNGLEMISTRIESEKTKFFEFLSEKCDDMSGLCDTIPDDQKPSSRKDSYSRKSDSANSSMQKQEEERFTEQLHIDCNKTVLNTPERRESSETEDRIKEVEETEAQFDPTSTATVKAQSPKRNPEPLPGESEAERELVVLLLTKMINPLTPSHHAAAMLAELLESTVNPAWRDVIHRIAEPGTDQASQRKLLQLFKTSASDLDNPSELKKTSLAVKTVKPNPVTDVSCVKTAGPKPSTVTQTSKSSRSTNKYKAKYHLYYKGEKMKVKLRRCRVRVLKTVIPSTFSENMSTSETRRFKQKSKKISKKYKEVWKLDSKKFVKHSAEGGDEVVRSSTAEVTDYQSKRILGENSKLQNLSQEKCNGNVVCLKEKASKCQSSEFQNWLLPAETLKGKTMIDPEKPLLAQIKSINENLPESENYLTREFDLSEEFPTLLQTPELEAVVRTFARFHRTAIHQFSRDLRKFVELLIIELLSAEITNLKSLEEMMIKIYQSNPAATIDQWIEAISDYNESLQSILLASQTETYFNLDTAVQILLLHSLPAITELEKFLSPSQP